LQVGHKGYKQTKERKDFWLRRGKQNTGKWPECEVIYILGPVLFFFPASLCWRSTECLRGCIVARLWHYCEEKPKNI